VVPIAFARPAWWVVRRSLRMLTGLAMATIVLALTAGGWQGMSAGGSLPDRPHSAVTTLVQVADPVLRPGSGEAAQRLGIDQRPDRDEVGRLSGDNRAELLVPPLRKVERPSWAPMWKPAATPYSRSEGTRAPPRG
jgi:hypothetical protein